MMPWTMLLSHKYQPQTLSEITLNKTIAMILEKHTLYTIPHLLVYGQPGIGKRTLIYAFINHIFGKKIKTHQRNIEIITSGDKKIDISYKESNEYIEICPSDYNYKDKDVMQTMVKSMAETKPIMSLISKKEKTLKIIIIVQAEKLTRGAQAALRRTLETYAGNFRMILICNDLTSIIDPIKSRVLCLRMQKAPHNIIFNEVLNISKQEKICLSDDVIDLIVRSSGGNFRRALFFLQQFCSVTDENPKRQKKDNRLVKLDWEIVVSDIVTLVCKTQTNMSILKIRNMLNDIIIKCVPPQIVLKRIFNDLKSKLDKKYHHNLCRLTTKYSSRIVLGTKSIFHLEAYIIAVAMLVNKK